MSSNLAGFSFAVNSDAVPILRIGQFLCSKLTANQRAFSVLVGMEWVSDALIQQLASASMQFPGVIADNRYGRGSGPILRAAFIGWEAPDKQICHGLPPHIPATLSEISLCSSDEIIQITDAGYGYLQYLIKPMLDFSVADIIAHHINEIKNHRDHAWLRGYLENFADFLIEDPDLLLRILDLSKNSHRYINID